MGDIFHHTETISFGSNPIPSHHPSLPPKRNFSPAGRYSQDHRSSRGGNHTESSDMPAPVFSHEKALPSTPSNALSELIASMKPTFFPPISSEATRCIILSEAGNTDPMLLIKTGDTSLLIGMGIDSLVQSGKTYPTFPDMRLVSSERERLAGWILREVPQDWHIFSLILEDLGFPPVYASRNIIATIRNNMNNDTILKQCRFFELFSESLTQRKIRSLTLSPGENSTLVYHTHSGTLIDALAGSGHAPHITGEGVVLMQENGTFFVRQQEKEDMHFDSGEILLLSQKNALRHPLKFTLDIFYIDEKSVGVVAGYTLKDRKELAENGFLTFVLEEDHTRRAILGHIYIDSRGFVHAYEMIRVHKEIIRGIRSIYEQTILENPRIERPDLVAIFRKEVIKLCFLITGRAPVVMPIIQEH